LIVGFAIRDDANDPLQPQRQAFLNGHRSLDAITHIPIADAQAQREGPVATDPEAQ